MSNLKNVLGVTIGKAFSMTLKTALDLLFPAEDTVQKIEASGSDELLKHLPPSEAFSNSTESGSGSSVISTSGSGSALFAYQDERVKQLVWEIKYYRNEKITDTVGALMAERILSEFSSKEAHKSKAHTEQEPERPFLLVPIPLTSRRLRERGFNHTELLARAVLKHLNKKSAGLVTAKFSLETSLLKKIRHTPKQSSITDRNERFANISGAFSVTNQHAVARKIIILVDDVVTTGATVGEARRVLVEAGVKEVWVFAIAH